MNVLLINGSPHANGNTAVALREMERIFQENQVKTEWIQVGNKDIRGCVACYGCTKKGACVFDDLVNETAPKFEAVRFIMPLQMQLWLRFCIGCFIARHLTNG